MKSINGENRKTVLSYCKVCRRTLTIPINLSLVSPSPSGGLWNYVYVHEKPNGESAHALVILLDQNLGVRRAEVVDMCIESSGCIADFEVQAHCSICQQDLEVPIDGQKFQEAIDGQGFYKQTFIHGSPPHSIIVLINDQKTVFKAQLSDSEISLK